MLTKSEIKRIKSLQQKKFRKELGLFVVEGTKMVHELLNSQFEIETIYTIHMDLQAKCKVVHVSSKELERISTLKTANQSIAIAKIPEYQINDSEIKNKLSLVLENIQDPGNLGTIIRIASWFGIDDIVCSTDTVECYNPKVVQSTMGAIFRVKVHYLDISKYIRQLKTSNNFGIYATHLEGKSIYKTNLKPNGLVILGNESSGLSDHLSGLIEEKIKIPSFPEESSSMESLNVAVAAGIICAEFRKTH